MQPHTTHGYIHRGEKLKDQFKDQDYGCSGKSRFRWNGWGKARGLEKEGEGGRGRERKSCDITV